MKSTQRPGMSVIEVLVALGMASILIFSVGNLVSTTHRLNSASAAQQQATLAAQAQIEQLVSMAASDTLSATPIFSVTNDGSKKYTVDTSTTPWTLIDVTATPGTAWVTLTVSNGDSNVQNVTSSSTWQSGSLSHTETITTILTDWKNLVP